MFSQLITCNNIVTLQHKQYHVLQDYNTLVGISGQTQTQIWAQNPKPNGPKEELILNGFEIPKPMFGPNPNLGHPNLIQNYSNPKLNAILIFVYVNVNKVCIYFFAFLSF